jgi:hypothetical protein
VSNVTPAEIRRQPREPSAVDRANYPVLLPDRPFLCILQIYVDEPSEERANLHLLYVLYVCVFWRGEAEHLAI